MPKFPGQNFCRWLSNPEIREGFWFSPSEVSHYTVGEILTFISNEYGLFVFHSLHYLIVKGFHIVITHKPHNIMDKSPWSWENCVANCVTCNQN